MPFRLISVLILIFTFANVLHTTSVLADTETKNLNILDSIRCFNTSSKALNNHNPVIGTKTDCELMVNNPNLDSTNFFNSNIRVRIGSAAQSPVCINPETSITLYYVTCKNIPVSGRAGFQTVKVNGKIIGKIKVESSIPTLELSKIVHIDDQKDVNDPNHSYQLQISSKNFKTGINGYRIIVYPKDLKNPLKSKLTMQNGDQTNIYLSIDSFTRSQLSSASNEICVIVARYNRIFPKAKSCKSLPASEPNKQITSEVFSKALDCPEFIDISKGQTSLKCSLNLPEGSIKYDENYYGTKDMMVYDLVKEPESGFTIGTNQTSFGVDFVGRDLGKCKVSSKEFSCDINLDKIKQNDIILPYKAVIGVQYTSFSGDMSDYKIVKSVEIR